MFFQSKKVGKNRITIITLGLGEEQTSKYVQSIAVTIKSPFKISVLI